jgi:dephospho-CoA kinase
MTVGVTGNIGSGKSLVCQFFSVLGIPVYHADERAKWLLNNNVTVMEMVVNLLGTEAYLPDGLLNKKWIADKVFHDSELLQAYNQIIHPAVAADSEEWQALHNNTPYTIREAALLFEAGSNKSLDKVICVVAPEAIRLERVIKRDNSSEESVLARMRNQWPEEKKAAMSDLIIVNDGVQAIIPQVWQIHHQLLLS